jgi:hypothetical protein
MKAAESPIRATVPAEGARPFALSYLLALAVGGLSVIVLFGVALVSLDSVGRLPPPQLANTLCIDEKLRFLRASSSFDAPSHRPTVLAVGSSVSWRTFDGEAVERATAGRATPFNGGFCALKMNETAFTTRYFLERYPSVRDVVTILAPQDMTDCRNARAQIFDPHDVDRYVFGDTWVFPLYLKYFDPFSFVKNIFRMRNAFRWGFAFDRYGGLPIDTKEIHARLIYGNLEAYDAECFTALRGLASELKADGRRLVVATMPLHPDWLERYDPQHRRVSQFEQRIDDALAGTGAVHWRPKGFTLQRDDFVDAIHIRWSAAQGFSRALVEETHLGQLRIESNPTAASR